MSQSNRITLAKCSEISLHFGQKTILDSATFEIKNGEIIGVVGRNGSGKSSFLKLIAQKVEPDEGRLEFKTGTTVCYMAQDFDLSEDLTVFQAIAQSWFQNLQADSENTVFVADILDNIEPWKHLSPERHETIIQQVQDLILNLSCPPPETLIKNLSGGEKRKVALAANLISKPDILILDEPTNHLDIVSIEHLEKTLKQFVGAVLLVSHDRYFLDKVTTRIVEIYDTKLFQHPGNYQSYLESKAVRLEIANTQDDRRLAFLKRELTWVRAGVKARGTKDKGRMQRFQDVKNQKGVLNYEDMDFLLPKVKPLGNKIINFEGVEISFADKAIIKNFSYIMQPGTILGLIGPNGSGKTSLIKAILSEVSVSHGRIVVGMNTVFNYQDQEKRTLNLDSTPFMEIGGGQETTNFGEGMINVRKYLKRYLFDNLKIMTPIRSFSGGEKARILLAKILKEQGNCLILDEPTNDLDLETIRVLEESILAFGGVTIVVSHDRYFLNRVCNQILSLEGNGAFSLTQGNYDDYLERKQRLSSDSKPSLEIKAEVSTKLSGRELRQNEKELKSLERQITSIETQVKELELEFNDFDLYSKNPAKYTKKVLHLEDLRTRLGLLMQDWEWLQS